MQTDSIETILARLMPPALSEDCQSELDSLFEDSSDSKSETTSELAPKRLRWKILATGMAAALVGLLGHAFFVKSSPNHSFAITHQNSYGLVLVGKTDRIESMTDEGWRDSDGAVMQAVRLNVVAENRLRDEETGILMKISEPREELLLTPISTF